MYLSNWDVYWFTRIEEIKGLLLFEGDAVAAITVMGLLLYGGISALLSSDGSNIDTATFKLYVKKAIKPLCLWLSVATLSTILSTFIPTQKEMAAIIMLPAIVNNEELQKVPDNLLKLLNVRLAEWLEEGEDTKK